jgi:DNA-binding response OmpR family regulator
MRVLFADDDDSTRSLLSAVLAGLGHDAVGVADGTEAWAAFDRQPVPLVVLDIQMPGIDGLALCRRIRGHARGASTFILIVTARDGPEDLDAVLEAGADDYLTKPCTPENLRARLRIAERRIGHDAARRDTEAELARSRWLAGVGETTLALEHEINNPLSALLGHAELLLMDEVAEEQLEHLTVIREQAGRIADVVRRLARLKNPRSVEYLSGAKMIDLSKASKDVNGEQ